MKRFILSAVAGLLLAPLGLAAQSDADVIQRATAALAERSREGAMVVRWNADHTHEVLQEGTNGWLCYDRSNEGRRPAFAVQCTNAANLERIAQNRKFAAEAADRQASNAMVAEAEANGTRVEVAYGSMWLAMNGEDQAGASIHRTIAVPGGTAASTGFPECRAGGAACIMAGGTGAAHLMVP